MSCLYSLLEQAINILCERHPLQLERKLSRIKGKCNKIVYFHHPLKDGYLVLEIRVGVLIP